MLNIARAVKPGTIGIGSGIGMRRLSAVPSPMIEGAEIAPFSVIRKYVISPLEERAQIFSNMIHVPLRQHQTVTLAPGENSYAGSAGIYDCHLVMLASQKADGSKVVSVVHFNGDGSVVGGESTVDSRGDLREALSRHSPEETEVSLFRRVWISDGSHGRLHIRSAAANTTIRELLGEQGFSIHKEAVIEGSKAALNLRTGAVIAESWVEAIMESLSFKGKAI